jgi:hypothetical protein
VPYDLGAPTTKAFRELTPKSPLNNLGAEERKLLFSLLTLYARTTPPSGKGRSDDDPLDKLAKVVAEAGVFGAKLESEVFGGLFSAEVRSFVVGFEDLPRRLIDFSNLLGSALNLFGKNGHKGEHFVTLLLIVASEFVRLQTGRHNDEYLAELFQLVGNPSLAKDLSGDAIRKKRNYVKKNYPQLYAQVLEMAKSCCRNPTRVGPS